MSSPIGDLGLTVDESDRLVRIDFLSGDDGSSTSAALESHFDAGERLEESSERTARVTEQLQQYFDGERRDFDLELAPRGTDFQKQVWRQLLDIPAGETCTYADIARRLGRPGAARAVGRANATNPIPIVVPCHRVVGADGTLTGYAGGLPIKRGLLEIEGCAEPSLF
ncbi:MAG: methylated-DNA--[protein]-cysteine S-methyltransferase [bacterium]|nr:methylated-DNA--[protein]-cysteine S-methyltransferase [bacterium]